MARPPKSNSIQAFKSFIASLTKVECPIFIAAGEEDFFLDQLVGKARSLVPKDLADFNLTLLYGEEHRVEQVVNAAKEYPMMAERRVVIVKNFQQLSGINAKDAQEVLLAYLRSPNPASLLLLTDPKALNKRANFGKTLAKDSAHHKFFAAERVPEQQLTDWVMQWVSSHHTKDIEPDAAELLWQLSGNDLRLLASEIEKVVTASAEENPIGFDRVKESVGQNRAFSLFEIKNALMAKQIDRAMAMARQQMELFNASGEVIKLINLLFSSFQSIWQLQMFMHRGLSQQQVAQQTGMNAWVLKRSWEEARRVPAAAIPLIMEALLDADKAIKGMSNQPAEGIMYMTLKRISNALTAKN